MRRTHFILSIILLFSLPAIASDEIDPAAVAAEMSWDEYWAHVIYFASDELEGRDTGSEGYDLAAKYTAEKFEAAGLQPFGDDSSYYQLVPFNRAHLKEATFDLNFITDKGVLGTEYGETATVNLNTDDESFKGSGELVFVGYGNIIPEADINDYEGVDVTDKVVVYAVGAPEGVPDSLQLGTRSKLRIADEQGARGVVMFSPGKWRKEKKEFAKYHRWLGGSRMYISDPEHEKKRNDLEMIYILKESKVRKLFRKSGMNLRRELRKMKAGETRSKPMNAEVSCSYDMRFENNDCKNIVGLLPGTDSLLQNEYVVVGAHLDHVGIRSAVEGDSIYNGLWDNATGSGVTLSIAETFHKAGIRPKRSIVFINYTGEEKGLLGSHYFANTYGLDSIDIAVNVNIDMLGGPIHTHDITPLGYNHSTVSEAVDMAAADLGLSLNDATKMEKEFIHRSDQMSFMKIGVPPLYINSGIKPVNPEVDAEATFRVWEKTRYHKPSDDLDQPYDVEGFFNGLKANFLSTYYLTNVIKKIEWYDDSWAYEEHVKPALDKSD